MYCSLHFPPLPAWASSCIVCCCCSQGHKQLQHQSHQFNIFLLWLTLGHPAELRMSWYLATFGHLALG